MSRTELNYKKKHLLRHPCLHGKFFARRSLRGAAVCWHEWCHVHECWGTSWGVGCKDMAAAKAVRKMLNSRVGVFPGDFGIPFDLVVQFVGATTARMK